MTIRVKQLSNGEVEIQFLPQVPKPRHAEEEYVYVPSPAVRARREAERQKLIAEGKLCPY